MKENFSSLKNHDHAAKKIIAAILRGDTQGAWVATTNRPAFGGLNKAARAQIHRALRRAGFSFYLACHGESEENLPFNTWGIASGEGMESLKKDPSILLLAEGYTLRAAAHKLGGGDAAKGFQTFHGWN